ncbi:MAG: cytochrome-c oxidase, cbb3-type subunit II [Rhodospirillaceae bacterium]|jgi:cytochrome c oxidase cbb3-type subunit II|nr:cytochrome-c oxidase, cbb3-type subunit II [Rhodospirillaceae bacterium]MBT4219952.1 cytochrome-c oxidase, cbb3-type subunit II [Rhodospirillaceae bacterium]MBT4463106.1 cytochrome-c oxidase, cbb3-type subunit II [Rhodospirillaceae bacterium]MBT5014142.1 cytochrome-c oxidase, cbb3-type subunit II [Rhodospirillaceae bacterium]MBT5308154.1 cytochrome-c oxidase, cbb3-type subunit II [Rhodospirillaceae bacterium]
MQEKMEKNVILLAIATLITISIGGLVQLVPLYALDSTIEEVEGMRPYSPLELAGRNIYVREGCYLCHSQMIRPFRDEIERYGKYSLAAESMYDHPFQWGSKRTGPDVARVGGKYSNDWHTAHMINPRSVVPESIMPGYPFMATTELSYDDAAEHLKTLSIVGVPYTSEQVASAVADVKAQATGEGDVDAMLARYPKAAVGDFDGNPDKLTELDAMIAYLQMLGRLVDYTNYKPEMDYR